VIHHAFEGQCGDQTHHHHYCHDAHRPIAALSPSPPKNRDRNVGFLHYELPRIHSIPEGRRLCMTIVVTPALGVLPLPLTMYVFDNEMDQALDLSLPKIVPLCRFIGEYLVCQQTAGLWNGRETTQTPSFRE
jgi:hypothetical protein